MEFGHRQSTRNPGDGSSLSSVPPSVAQSAAADHGTKRPPAATIGASTSEFVANPRGGMLIHFFRRQKAEIENFAGMQHGVRGARQFPRASFRATQLP